MTSGFAELQREVPGYPMRLLMYSQDGTGLGHLRRAGNIAREVLARAPESDVLIMSDSASTPLLPALQGLDYLKLPTIVKSGRASSQEASWRTATLSLGIPRTLELRSRLISHTFAAFEPDAVLIDHMPLGALGELRPMLEAAARSRHRTRLYLGLRDVLDAPEAIRRSWSESGAYAFLHAYESVLIYGCQDIYDAVVAYGLEPHTRNVVYCNYVGPSGKAIPTTRRDFEEHSDVSQERHLLLVMSGGGADGYRMAEAVLEALPWLVHRIPLRVAILTGPNMPAAERWALGTRARHHPAEILGMCDDVPALLQKASLVVTMGGYNSLCEVVDARKKALVVPRRGPSEEQRIRSRLFAARGLVRTLDADELEPRRLAAELAQMLDNDALPDRTAQPPLDGAQRAAEVLLRAPGEEAR